MFTTARALLCVALLFAPGAAQALDRYQVKLLGVPVGTLLVTRNGTRPAYDFTSKFSTTGVLAIVKDVEFIMRSTGAFDKGLPDPQAYAEQMNTGERVSQAQFRLPDDDAMWDPNTALIFALSDRPREVGCHLDRDLNDGERGHALVIRESEWEGEILSCSGSMTRTTGYTAQELKKLSEHNFTVYYRAEGDQLIFTAAQAGTIYGKVQILPR